LDALDSSLIQPAKALVDAAGAAGLLPQVTSTLRSHSEQARLYRRFQAGLSQYPVAVPGTSAHEYGFAFDVVVTPMAALGELGALWESWGGEWGGRGSDPIHFQAPGFTLTPGSTQAFTPPQEDTTTKLVNFIAALLPGVDAVAAAGFVLSLFPDFGQAELAYYLQHPYSMVKLLYGF
jgi:hypothetical protein